ncbi:MAG: hypothetical protein KKD77_20165, partial [Gammaproteobacteria bacterium]|nr:hypothetical protein [Gammaproteobacteria bacterium]
MAFSTTAGGAEYVISGAGGVRGIYTEKRKYDKSDIIVYQDRTYAMFDWLLRDKMSKVTVADFEPRLFTKQETPVKFDVHSDDTDTAYEGDTLRISDTKAKWLQQYDILTCKDIFCDSDGANYSTTKFSSGYMPESMIVNSVTLSGTASGIAKVMVTRGNGYSAAAAAAGTVQTILTEYKLIKTGNAMEDGWTAPTAKWLEPTYVDNYVQTFSRTWSETEGETNTDVFAKETMSDKATRNRRDLFREVENQLLFGRKGKHVTASQFQFTTGGIVEYVSASGLDGENRYIDFGGAFDLEKMREKAEIIYNYGSDTKWWFCGSKFLTQMWNTYEKFIIKNDELSRRWGWTVWEIDWGHGVAMCMRHPLLREM